MDKFTLTVELGNAAMETVNDVADALIATAAKLQETERAEDGIIRDDNGNTVGGYKFH